MGSPPKIYLDACPIIDLAKHKAKLLLSPIPSEQANRENNVWFCLRILEAARRGDIRVYTSSLSINECTQVEQGVPNPPPEIQEFFNMLLCSGKSGIILVQPTMTIQISARDMKWNAVKIKPMDSLHMATALHMGCAEFITTDGRIPTEAIKGIGHKIAIVQAHQTKLLPEKYRQDDLSIGT